jgi:hypothetical protein
VFGLAKHQGPMKREIRQERHVHPDLRRVPGQLGQCVWASSPAFRSFCCCPSFRLRWYSTLSTEWSRKYHQLRLRVVARLRSCAFIIDRSCCIPTHSRISHRGLQFYRGITEARYEAQISDTRISLTRSPVACSMQMISYPST